MPLTEPWDKLLPEMRLRVREIVRAIRDDKPMPAVPNAGRYPGKRLPCPACGKMVFRRGMYQHMRQHRNYDSWIRP